MKHVTTVKKCDRGYHQIKPKVEQTERFIAFTEVQKLVSNDGWAFNVHKSVLAKHSPFLRDLFIQSKDDESEIVISRVRGSILELVLIYMYTENVLKLFFLRFLNLENFTELLIASDFLQIDELRRELIIFSESKLSVNNCLKIYVASVQISDTHLSSLSYRIIQLNFHSLLYEYESDLMNMPVVLLKEILSDNNLLVVGENVIWDFITKWVRRDPPNRFAEVFDFLKCLKIGDVEESLAKKIIDSDLISNNPYCENLEDTPFQKFQSNLDALRCVVDICWKSSEMSTSDYYSHRLPYCLHLIICDIECNETEKQQIYVTYDEKVDIWRKVGEADKMSTFSVIGRDIYSFDWNMNGQIFNLYEKEWRGIRKFKSDDFYCKQAFTIKHNIYFILYSSYFGGDRLMFECYNTKTGLLAAKTLWHPVSNFKATVFQQKIYMVSQMSGGENLSMLAQVYDEVSNSWSIKTPPNIFYSDITLISFNGKLYKIDVGVGINRGAVEVFYPEINEWSRIEDLPYVIDRETEIMTYARVLNDKLFVFHDFESEEWDERWFCVLNENGKTWEQPNEFIHEYDDLYIRFAEPIYDKKLIKFFVKESRNPATSLEKSMF